jgi:muconolactone D-isomerase
MGQQEYLVAIAISLPPEMSRDLRKEATDAELARGRELLERGAIRRIWRIPGRTANVGIWAAESATELHELLTSLPLSPWMTVEVTALATHPLEAGLSDKGST